MHHLIANLVVSAATTHLPPLQHSTCGQSGIALDIVSAMPARIACYPFNLARRPKKTILLFLAFSFCTHQTPQLAFFTAQPFNPNTSNTNSFKVAAAVAGNQHFQHTAWQSVPIVAIEHGRPAMVVTKIMVHAASGAAGMPKSINDQQGSMRQCENQLNIYKEAGGDAKSKK